MKRMQSSVMTSVIIITFVLIGSASAAPTNGGENANAAVSRGTAQSASPQSSKPAAQKDADCGCEVKVPQDLLAVVNGVKVTVKDVDESLKDRVQELQNQVI